MEPVESRVLPPDESPAAQERRHRPADDILWDEAWYFDFNSPDGTVGGFVRLGLQPNLGLAWYWGYLVRRREQLLVARHHEAALPPPHQLELREDGLWAALYCETPHDHWTVALEAFAVGLDDPAEALRGERGERGDRVPLGLDLEWEGTAPPRSTGRQGYGQACRVSGEILVGGDRLDFAGFGHRHHRWGPLDWWSHPWVWSAGRLHDGTTFHGHAEPDAHLDFAGLPLPATLSLAGLDLAVTPLLHAPIPVEGPAGERSRLYRALCRFETSDGRSGYGWTEWNRPRAGPD